MIAPRELLDTSIGQIRTLVAFLREQLGEDSDGSKSEVAESRACRAILAHLESQLAAIELAGFLPLAPDLRANREP